MAGVSTSDYNALLRENARLVAQNRKLQELVETMREEIADANAEIAAGKRLYEEQRTAYLHRLESERSALHLTVERLRSAAERPDVRAVATNTFSEISTSTVMDAATNTITSLGSPPSARPHDFRNSSREERRAPGNELRQFSDYLSRTSGYAGRDLSVLFSHVLGATSVSEVCAVLCERDLCDFGIPPAKARQILHLVMDHTSRLLGVSPS
jgi:hypothetical protein